MSQKPNIPVKKDTTEIPLDVRIDSTLTRAVSLNNKLENLLIEQGILKKDVRKLLNIPLPVSTSYELIKQVKTDIIKDREVSTATKLMLIRDYLQGLQALLEMKEWDILRLVMLNKENPVNEESS